MVHFLTIEDKCYVEPKWELEKYLWDEIHSNDPSFDDLAWWKKNVGRYKVLLLIAVLMIVTLINRKSQMVLYFVSSILYYAFFFFALCVFIYNILLFFNLFTDVSRDSSILEHDMTIDWVSIFHLNILWVVNSYKLIMLYFWCFFFCDEICSIVIPVLLTPYTFIIGFVCIITLCFGLIVLEWLYDLKIILWSVSVHFFKKFLVNYR